MANWTSPHIWSVGEEGTSPAFNQYQRDNLQYLYDRLVPRFGASGGSVVTHTLTTGTWLLIATFQPSGAPVNCGISGPSGGITYTPFSPDAKHTSLVYSAVIVGASENWTASTGGGGLVSFWAVRVAV
jgi:hypothetical protein